MDQRVQEPSCSFISLGRERVERNSPVHRQAQMEHRYDETFPSVTRSGI